MVHDLVAAVLCQLS